MDHMSRLTERQRIGRVEEPENISLFSLFLYLVKQEIPRTTIPVLLSVILLLLGWFTPLGPVITILSSAIAAVFLAWDNTDLVPARRMDSFSGRFRFFAGGTLPFHPGIRASFSHPRIEPIASLFCPCGRHAFSPGKRYGHLQFKHLDFLKLVVIFFVKV